MPFRSRETLPAQNHADVTDSPDQVPGLNDAGETDRRGPGAPLGERDMEIVLAKHDVVMTPRGYRQAALDRLRNGAVDSQTRLQELQRRHSRSFAIRAGRRMANAIGVETGAQNNETNHREVIDWYWRAVGGEDDRDLSWEPHVDRRDRKVEADFEKLLVLYLGLKLEDEDQEGREDAEAFLRTCEGYDDELSVTENLAQLPPDTVRRAYDAYMHDKAIKLPSEVASDKRRQKVLDEASADLERHKGQRQEAEADLLVGVKNAERAAGNKLLTWSEFNAGSYAPGSFEEQVKHLGPQVYQRNAELIAAAIRTGDPDAQQAMYEVLKKS